MSYSTSETAFTGSVEEFIAFMKEMLDEQEQKGYIQEIKNVMETMEKNRDERDAKDPKIKKQDPTLVIPPNDIKAAMKKINKGKDFKIKFQGDAFTTTIRMKEGKLYAYDKEYPNGRPVKSTDEMNMAKNYEDVNFLRSPKSMFQHFIMKMGYTFEQSMSLSGFMNFNSGSSFTKILVPLVFFKAMNDRGSKVMMLDKEMMGVGMKNGNDNEKVAKCIACITRMAMENRA